MTVRDIAVLAAQIAAERLIPGNLKAFSQGTPAEIVLSAVRSLEDWTPEQETERTNLDLDLVIAGTQELVQGAQFWFCKVKHRRRLLRVKGGNTTREIVR